MKGQFFLIVLTMLSLSAYAQKKVETVLIKTSIYCDHCNRCESCGARLEQAVFKQKGIKRVDIDEAMKIVKVVYNPQKTTADQIRQAIAKAGFDADTVKANPDAYELLDGCCKK
jgi:periplasmic mercuric ion binding protein